MKIGDWVLTKHGECGKILKSWQDEIRNDESYDWWVEIHFNSHKGKFETVECYRNSELEKISENCC